MYYVVQHGDYGDYINGEFKTLKGANRFAVDSRYHENCGNVVVEATSEQEALSKANGKYTDYCGS